MEGVGRNCVLINASVVALGGNEGRRVEVGVGIAAGHILVPKTKYLVPKMKSVGFFRLVRIKCAGVGVGLRVVLNFISCV